MKEFWSYDLDGILKRLKTNKSGLSSKFKLVLKCS